MDDVSRWVISRLGGRLPFRTGRGRLETAKFPPPPNWILATEKECNDWNQSIWEMKNDKSQITCWVIFKL